MISRPDWLIAWQNFLDLAAKTNGKERSDYRVTWEPSPEVSDLWRVQENGPEGSVWFDCAASYPEDHGWPHMLLRLERWRKATNF